MNSQESTSPSTSVSTLSVPAEERIRFTWTYVKRKNENHSESETKRKINGNILEIYVNTDQSWKKQFELTFEVNPRLTIRGLKRLIQEKTGILEQKQSLTFNGQLLLDGSSIYGSCILNESILTLTELKETYKIIVWHQSGQFPFNVNSVVTIKKIKLALCKLIGGVDYISLNLYFAFTLLEDNKILEDYKIEAGDRLNLIIR